jgi:hypothetical protein
MAAIAAFGKAVVAIDLSIPFLALLLFTLWLSFLIIADIILLPQ